MKPIIYDLSRFSLVEAVKRLGTICYNYKQMCIDNNLDKEDEKLKEELKEAIPILKEDIISRINEL